MTYKSIAEDLGNTILFAVKAMVISMVTLDCYTANIDPINVISKASWYIVNENPSYGPRDHGSLILHDDNLYLLSGFYRRCSTYQDC
jgi:hypothetical protein